MKVKDGGSPATAGDEVSAVWVSTEVAAEDMVKAMGDLLGNVYTYNLIGGNLVVFGVTSTTDPDGSSKAAILMSSGVTGEGLENAPGLLNKSFKCIFFVLCDLYSIFIFIFILYSIF